MISSKIENNYIIFKSVINWFFKTTSFRQNGNYFGPLSGWY